MCAMGIACLVFDVFESQRLKTMLPKVLKTSTQLFKTSKYGLMLNMQEVMAGLQWYNIIWLYNMLSSTSFGGIPDQISVMTIFIFPDSGETLFGIFWTVKF